MARYLRCSSVAVPLLPLPSVRLGTARIAACSGVCCVVARYLHRSSVAVRSGGMHAAQGDGGA